MMTDSANSVRLRAGGPTPQAKMFAAAFDTTSDYSALVARLVVGVVMFPHGAQHLLGWFGGLGFAGTMEYFAGVGVPAAIGFLTIVTEFFGALTLIAGLASRAAALGIGSVMIGAALVVHLPYGFFMDWFGGMQGEGFEYHILMLGLSAVVVMKGSGALSLDRYLLATSLAKPLGVPR